MTRLVRRAPASLIPILAALFLAGALAVFSANPAHAQEDPVRPLITLQAELLPGEVSIPQGASMVFRLTRSGDASGEHVVKLHTREPRRISRNTFSENYLQHVITFGPGETVAVVRVPVLGSDGSATHPGDPDGEIPDHIDATLVLLDLWKEGAESVVSIPIRDPEDDDFIVSIAPVEDSITEGDDAEFTLTRTGDISSALTAKVYVEDPGQAMLGNHWDEPLQPNHHRREVTFEADSATATASFPTRPNARDTGDLTLTAYLLEDDDFTYWVGSSFSAGVTVTDDDTAPEFSLSVAPGEILEGEDVTFTVTRHGDTSEALEEAPFVLSIGPNFRRHVWPIYEEPQDYGVTMAAGESSVDMAFRVRIDQDSRDFRFEAEFKPAPGIPKERFGEYLVIRGASKVGAGVTHQAKMRVKFASVGGETLNRLSGRHYEFQTRFFEGQEVTLVLERTGTPGQIARELEVRVRYTEPQHPGFRVLPGGGRYNPSDRDAILTFPPGEIRLQHSFTTLIDHVEEEEREDGFFLFLVRPPFSDYINLGSGRGSSIVGYMNDNPRAVSIAVADNAPDVGEDGNDEGGSSDAGEHTIEEGETAEFTLTRHGSTDEALTVNVVIDDPGHFRRGNHWRDTPDNRAPVTFAAGSDTATLSVATRDDLRDIPDNTITVTIPPSQGRSYRPAFGDEGAASAAVTVTDNDTAPQVTLSVSAATIEEGGTATFTIGRNNSQNSLEFFVMYGLQGEQERHVLGLGRGESRLTVALAPEDNDYDDPDERVYEMALLPQVGIPEEERAQYYTVSGPTSVSVTVTDNDLPLVGVEQVEESYGEDSHGYFRFVREGQTETALDMKAVLTQVGNSYFEIYQYLLGEERTYTIPAGRDSKTRLVQLQWDDGDEDDTSMTITLAPGDGYRIDPDRASATFQVIDRDPEPTLSVSGATASEGAQEIQFRVSVSSSVRPPTRREITVDYTTRDGTAVAGQDYTTHTGTLTIRPGHAATISVPLLDDRIVELEEAFTIVLRSPVNAVLQDGAEELTAVGAITDDEPHVSLAAVNNEVEEGDDVVYEFTRTGDTAEALTVYFIAGYASDSDRVRQSIEIPAGQSSVRRAFATMEDEQDAEDKSYEAYLIPPPVSTDLPQYYISRNSPVSVTVRDDDLPSVTIEAVRGGVFEGHPAVFTLTREGLRDEPLTVNISVTRTGDLFPAAEPPSTVTFARGSATVTLSVPTVGDTTLEEHGSVTAAITAADGYEAGEPSSATMEVADNDRGGVTLSIAAPNGVVEEGEDVVFTLTRSGGTSIGLTANVRVFERKLASVGLLEEILEDHYRDVAVTFQPGADTVSLNLPTEDENLNDGNSRWRARILLSADHGIRPISGRSGSLGQGR